MPKTYEANMHHRDYFTTASRIGEDGYNPKRTYYYNADGQLIRIREEWRGEVWTQTISGTTITGTIDQGVAYYTVYDPWVEI